MTGVGIFLRQGFHFNFGRGGAGLHLLDGFFLDFWPILVFWKYFLLVGAMWCISFSLGLRMVVTAEFSWGILETSGWLVGV